MGEPFFFMERIVPASNIEELWSFHGSVILAIQLQFQCPTIARTMEAHAGIEIFYNTFHVSEVSLADIGNWKTGRRVTHSKKEDLMRKNTSQCLLAQEEQR